MWCVCTGQAASCPSLCLATASSQVSPAGVLPVTLGHREYPSQARGPPSLRHQTVPPGKMQPQSVTDAQITTASVIQSKLCQPP